MIANRIIIETVCSRFPYDVRILMNTWLTGARLEKPIFEMQTKMLA
jgi:hypothetical protein